MKKVEGNSSFFMRVFNSRCGWAAFYVIITAVLTVILGFIFSLVFGNVSWEGFWRASSLMFWYFSAGAIVAAILLIITKIPINLTFGFGCGLYYGTIAAAWILEEFFSVGGSAGCSIGFVFAALVCYVVWLKKYKDNSEN